MRKFNLRKLCVPCMGFFLQGAVKSLSIVDVGVECGMIILHSSGIYASMKWENNKNGKAPFTELSHQLRITHWAFHFVYNIASLVLAYFLYQYAKNRDAVGVKRWLTHSIVFFILSIGVFISQTVVVKWNEMEYMCAAGCGIFIPYKIYGLWVVFSFYQEIRHYGGLNSVLVALPDADVESFFQGQKGADNVAQAQPYRQQDFEIPLDRLILDNDNLLGKGAYGTVLKGQLLPQPDDLAPYNFKKVGCCTVAVKTVGENVELFSFKALLDELKILSYLGQNENVCNLIGACTSEIKFKKLYIVVEFCALGSLLNYLKLTRGIFVDLVNKKEQQALPFDYVTVSDVSPSNLIQAPSTLTLIQWAMQIASGMNHIASRKVIHGDLAARNVLLTLDMKVKIADFGLSRQLHNCYNYKKSSAQPVPWRWLSIESLTDMSFSTQSDIWSYGVTIWELFSSGDTPYTGYEYNDEFVKGLQRNCIRLGKPHHASPEIYKIMWNCWQNDTEKRPRFSELVESFQELGSHYSTVSAKLELYEKLNC